MASGPYWHPKRGTWSVQYWDGRTRRVVVVKRRPGWNPGDPAPKKPPPLAFAELARLTKVEQVAKARAGKRVAIPAADDLDAASVVAAADVIGGSLWRMLEGFLAWCRGHGIERLDDVTSSVCALWLADQLAGLNRVDGDVRRGSEDRSAEEGQGGCDAVRGGAG